MKIKIESLYITIDNLQVKLIEAFPALNEINVIIYESFDNEWFDRRELINNRILNTNIIEALREVFDKYGTHGRMFRKDCARVFEIATECVNISENDGRINHLFSAHSQNG